MRGKDTIDLRVDPPPDLFIEIDITHSSLDRQEICAKLRVPEIWRFDGQTLSVHLLQPNGRYAIGPSSRCLPFLPVQELLPFLHFDPATDETTHLRRFADWVRQRFGRRS
jgi:Uma2 family endonuclease